MSRAKYGFAPNPRSRKKEGWKMKRTAFVILACAILIAVMVPMAHAYYYVSPTWVPIYQGVDYYAGTSGGVNIYAVKVDLWDPNVSLYASHDNGAATKEVTTEFGYQFNADHGCVVSANASYCDPTSTGQAATNVDIWGLGICDGTVVSPGYYGGGAQYNCQMLFTAAKAASIAITMDTPTGIHTAVTGNAYHLVGGYPLGATDTYAARTSFGLSQDGRYLYMGCVNYANIYQLSCWMIDLGAWDAINMDGGGSTCLTRADIGKVIPSGTERRVGVHLGVRSAPLTYVVDNPAGTFSANWILSTMSSQKYGADYRYRSTQAVSDMFTWRPSLPVAGNYEVFAWWPAGTNRSLAAPYIINYNGGSANVKVNQQTGGGQWNSLGTYPFAAGTAGHVKLSCWATTGYVVVADAVCFVKR